MTAIFNELFCLGAVLTFLTVVSGTVGMLLNIWRNKS